MSKTVRFVQSDPCREESRFVLALIVEDGYRATTQHRFLHYPIVFRAIVGAATFPGSHHLAFAPPSMTASRGESSRFESNGMWFGSAGIFRLAPRRPPLSWCILPLGLLAFGASSMCLKVVSGPDRIVLCPILKAPTSPACRESSTKEESNFFYPICSESLPPRRMNQSRNAIIVPR